MDKENEGRDFAKEVMKKRSELFNRPGRDPGRIPAFLAEIEKEWRKCPDMRFGQLMVSFISLHGDPFYLEEDEFLTEFKKYTKKFTADYSKHYESGWEG